jgi:AmmeMemoRadiSam system protein B/AmmeMemoRadiSam system protein A
MRTLFLFFLASFLTQFHPALSDAAPKREGGVRKPAVAGQFYPSDPQKLAGAVDCYLADAVTPFADRPIAIVSPHAGYIYSGQIAADAFKQASRHEYDVVVILGVNHTTAGFRDVSIYPAGGFETPLGVARIDEALAERLVAADERFLFDERVHVREHSIEVQVPFVQMVFPGAKILPAVIGSADLDLCARFGEVLADAVEGRRALIVASCDLSHFPACEDAERVDRKTLDAMKGLDAETFRSKVAAQMGEGIRELGTCACGEAAVVAAMVAAGRLGATGAQIISYANSGHTSVGERTRVVGYGAVAFVNGPDADNVGPPPAREADPGGSAEFTVDQKKALLLFARKTIRQYTETSTTPLARGFPPAAEAPRGAFVTLRKSGELRGCIGHMNDVLPLCQAVGYCALQAAFNDRRFTPLSPDELAVIDVEISVLTPYEMVAGIEDIRVGRDGVLMKKDGRSAVFLPSVAVEQGWTRDEMLAHLSVKAGLPSDAWKKNATFYTFQAEAFGESDGR